jgi:hypothetical protein
MPLPLTRADAGIGRGGGGRCVRVRRGCRGAWVVRGGCRCPVTAAAVGKAATGLSMFAAIARR